MISVVFKGIKSQITTLDLEVNSESNKNKRKAGVCSRCDKLSGDSEAFSRSAGGVEEGQSIIFPLKAGRGGGGERRLQLSVCWHAALHPSPRPALRSLTLRFYSPASAAVQRVSRRTF